MKLLSIMLVVMLLVAFAAPVFADEGGVPNDDAWWGQLHKLIAEYGSVSAMVHLLQWVADMLDMPLGQLIKVLK